MKKYKVPINDLHALTKKFPPELFTKPGDVHFKKEGYQKIAEWNAKIIQKALKGELKVETESLLSEACIDQKNSNFLILSNRPCLGHISVGELNVI